MYLKLFLILVVVIFIYINVRPHLSMILFVIELIRTLLVNSLTFTKNVSEQVVDDTSIGAKLVVNKILPTSELKLRCLPIPITVGIFSMRWTK